MTDTPVKGAPDLSVSQASKEATVNEAHRYLEQGADYYVIVDKDLTTAPGACADGAAYIVATAGGAWSTGAAKDIAIAVGTNASNGWLFVTPREGSKAYLQDEDLEYQYSGSAWAAYSPPAGSTALDDLSDVYVTAPSDGDVLTFDTSSPVGWKAQAPTGAITLDGLLDVDVSSSPGPSDGDYLTYVASLGLWVPGHARRVVSVLVTDPNGSALTTGDGKAYWRVPAVFHGRNLVAVAASVDTVSSSGLPTVQLRRKRSGVDADMLSTKVSIDANETDSTQAATQAVIDTANDDVEVADRIYFDVDVAGTGAKGLLVEMTFSHP